MLKVGIKVEEGVVTPIYKSVEDSKLNLMAKSFKKLYKGDREVPLDKKLQKSIEQGYLTLRGFERVLVGTGITLEMPQGYSFEILSKKGLALKTGLLVADAPSIIDGLHIGEVGIVLVNNSPFLSKVTLGDIVAQGVIRKHQHALWNRE